MNKSVSIKKALLIAVLCSVLAGSAVAALLLTHQIATVIVVKPKVSMGVFDVDGTTPLNSIDLGSLSLDKVSIFQDTRKANQHNTT